MKRPAAYLRISSAGQEKKDTAKTQESALVSWFEVRGISPHNILWYSDEAVSGTLDFDKRGDSAKLLEDASAGKIDYLVVYSISRLSRSENYDIFSIFVKMKVLGVSVRSISEGVDTEVEGGLFMAELLGLLAINDRRKKRKLMKRGFLRKSKEDNAYFGMTPIGYKKGPKSTLEIDEKAATYIRTVFRLYAKERKGAKKIADYMTALDTPYLWYPSRIDYILQNPVYTGESHYNKTKRLPGGGSEDRPSSEWVKLKVPSIIDKKTFEEAQRVRKQSLSHHTGYAKREFLCGTVRCAHCDASYWRTNNSNRTRYYKHSNKKKAPCSYKSKHIRAEIVEAPIWERIEQAALYPGNWRQYIGNAQGESHNLAEELDRIEAKLKKIERAQAKIDEMYFYGDTISEAHYCKLTSQNRRKKESLEGIIADLKARIGNQKVQEEKEKETEELLREYQEIALSASMEEKRHLADKLIDKVVIAINDDDEIELTVHWLE